MIAPRARTAAVLLAIVAGGWCWPVAAKPADCQTVADVAQKPASERRACIRFYFDHWMRQRVSISPQDLAELWALAAVTPQEPLEQRRALLHDFLEGVAASGSDEAFDWAMEQWTRLFSEGEVRDCLTLHWLMTAKIPLSAVTAARMLERLESAVAANLKLAPSLGKAPYEVSCILQREWALDETLKRGGASEFNRRLALFDAMKAEDFRKDDYLQGLLRQRLRDLVSELQRQPAPAAPYSPPALPDFLQNAAPELQDAWRYYRSWSLGAEAPPTKWFDWKNNRAVFHQRVSALLHSQQGDHWSSLRNITEPQGCLITNSLTPTSLSQAVALLQQHRVVDALLLYWGYHVYPRDPIVESWPAQLQKWSGLDVERLHIGAMLDAQHVYSVPGRTNISQERIARYLVQMESLPLSRDEQRLYLNVLSSYLYPTEIAGPAGDQTLRKALLGVVSRLSRQASEKENRDTAQAILERSTAETSVSAADTPKMEVKIPVLLRGLSAAGMRLDYRVHFSRPKVISRDSVLSLSGSCDVGSDNLCLLRFRVTPERSRSIIAVSLSTAPPQQSNDAWFGARLPVSGHPKKLTYDVVTAPLVIQLPEWPDSGTDVALEIQSKARFDSPRMYDPIPDSYRPATMTVHPREGTRLRLQPGYYTVKVSSPGSALQAHEVEVPPAGATLKVSYQQGHNVRFTVVAPGGDLREQTPACVLLRDGQRLARPPWNSTQYRYSCYDSIPTKAPQLSGLPDGRYTLQFFSSAENAEFENAHGKGARGNERYIVPPPAYEGRKVDFVINSRSPSTLDLGTIELQPARDASDR